MFYPGDPTEERKRALIAKLAGSRGKGGAAGGGFKVGRPAGAGFGRGIGFGGGGVGTSRMRGLAIPQMLSGYGQDTGGYGSGAIEPPQPPPFSFIGDQMGPGSFQQTYQGPSLGSLQGPSSPTVNPFIKQLLQGYGQQPQMPTGYGYY